VIAATRTKQVVQPLAEGAPAPDRLQQDPLIDVRQLLLARLPESFHGGLFTPAAGVRYKSVKAPPYAEYCIGVSDRGAQGLLPGHSGSAVGAAGTLRRTEAGADLGVTAACLDTGYRRRPLEKGASSVPGLVEPFRLTGIRGKVVR
jgi:hypothetical protein